MLYSAALARAIVMALAAAFVNSASAQSPNLLFAVTEGVTYQATPKEIRDKFAPVAEYVAKAAGRQVKIVLVPAYDDLRAGLARQEYDIAFIHPAHVALAAIKSGRYQAIAWTSGYTDYAVSLLTKSESPLRTLNDLRGHTVVTPDPDSITAAMVRAMFRNGNLPTTDARPPPPTAVRVIATRYQDAVPFYIEYDFAQVGATAAQSVVRTWLDRGGRVLAQSRAVPIKQLLVSTKLPIDEQNQIRDALINMTRTKLGRDALETVGYKGFVAPNHEAEIATMAWLGL